MTRDQLILEMYNHGHTAAQLAKHFKISTARICQILKACRAAGQLVRPAGVLVRSPVIDGDCVRVPLANRQRRIIGWAVVDAQDHSIVAGRLWCRTRSGYAISRHADDGGYDYLHRLICPGLGVGDHIDGDKMNCRRNNLRVCSQKNNTRNSAAPLSNTTGFKGVGSKRPGRFHARIMVDRKSIHLGTFGTATDAARAYDTAAIKYFGEFARLNFPSISLAGGPGVLSEAA